MTDVLSARVKDNYIAAPGHTRVNFQPDSFRETVNAMAGKIVAIRKKHPEIEALAACGHSGLMLMGALSYMTGLPQIAVRKSTAGNVADTRMVNGWVGCKGYLIIDDLVSSGGTVDRIIREIAEAHRKQVGNINAVRSMVGRTDVDEVSLPIPVAMLLYEQSSQYRLGAVLGEEPISIMLYSSQKESLELSDWNRARTPARREFDEKAIEQECAAAKATDEKLAQELASNIDFSGLTYDDRRITPKEVTESWGAVAENSMGLRVIKARTCKPLKARSWVDEPFDLNVLPCGDIAQAGFRLGWTDVIYGAATPNKRRLKYEPGDPGPDPPNSLLS